MTDPSDSPWFSRYHPIASGVVFLGSDIVGIREEQPVSDGPLCRVQRGEKFDPWSTDALATPYSQRIVKGSVQARQRHPDLPGLHVSGYLLYSGDVLHQVSASVMRQNDGRCSARATTLVYEPDRASMAIVHDQIVGRIEEAVRYFRQVLNTAGKHTWNDQVKHSFTYGFDLASQASDITIAGLFTRLSRPFHSTTLLPGATDLPLAF
ncbi:hypothetical protein J7355_15660 [Endozoicomonas sp. G2_2]|uniref:hypothetical protein n=1 Tax=Endozoicomonas sp. G2_2 TaxID=2821092 RepID=UPI001ADC4B41|nr:hypothetical protein [Endozoicomonas sp. G2_2]MBO9471526.1 hypothetical protein [Endozoicomonas sp. G2_2]